MTGVRIQHATVRLGGTVVLNDVSMEAQPRQVVGIIGPNGAGKTTLLRAAAGHVEPGAGSLTLGDASVCDLSVADLAQLRSFMSAAQPTDVPFTVRHVVTMTAGRTSDRKLSDALEATDTAHLVDRVYSSLSTGEQQRVGLARVLLRETPILLLDEPTASLDIGHQELIMTALRGYAADGRVVVAALHDLNLAAAHADRLVLLHSGVVVASGTPHEVLTSAMLSEVYSQPISVIPHPHRPCPLVLTVPQPGQAQTSNPDSSPPS